MAALRVYSQCTHVCTECTQWNSLPYSFSLSLSCSLSLSRYFSHSFTHCLLLETVCPSIDDSLSFSLALLLTCCTLRSSCTNCQRGATIVTLVGLAIAIMQANTVLLVHATLCAAPRPILFGNVTLPPTALTDTSGLRPWDQASRSSPTPVYQMVADRISHLLHRYSTRS